MNPPIIFAFLLIALSFTSFQIFENFNLKHALLVGFALSFSSTVYAVKVLEDVVDVHILDGNCLKSNNFVNVSEKGVREISPEPVVIKYGYVSKPNLVNFNIVCNSVDCSTVECNVNDGSKLRNC